MVKGSISDRIIKERRTHCNRCQKTACTCVHTGIAPISSHLIVPTELTNYNYMASQFYPPNYLVPNSIFTIDPNLLQYHSLQTLQPSPVPIISPVSSSSPSSPTSPPSPRSSPGTRRPFRTTKKFKCPECDKSFDYKHVLQNHERIHTGVKPYVCKICEKAFTRDHHLKTHIRLHTGEKPYICEYCPMRFVQVANLRRHLKVHDPIKCITCDKQFPDGNRLQRHLLEHDLDSRLCNICHDKSHVKSKCPLRISGKNDNDDDSDALSSGDSHTSSTGSEQSTRYETESLSQVLDLRRIVMNSTQSEPEDLSLKKYFQIP